MNTNSYPNSHYYLTATLVSLSIFLDGTYPEPRFAVWQAAAADLHNQYILYMFMSNTGISLATMLAFSVRSGHIRF